MTASGTYEPVPAILTHVTAEELDPTLEPLSFRARRQCVGAPGVRERAAPRASSANHQSTVWPECSAPQGGAARTEGDRTEGPPGAQRFWCRGAPARPPGSSFRSWGRWRRAGSRSSSRAWRMRSPWARRWTTSPVRRLGHHRRQRREADHDPAAPAGPSRRRDHDQAHDPGVPPIKAKLEGSCHSPGRKQCPAGLAARSAPARTRPYGDRDGSGCDCSGGVRRRPSAGGRRRAWRGSCQ